MTEVRCLIQLRKKTDNSEFDLEINCEESYARPFRQLPAIPDL